jgi:hypothetical protein
MIAAVSALALVSMYQQPSFPAWGYKAGDSQKFSVNGKVEIQPYSTGGTLTLTVLPKSDSTVWLKIDHDVVMEAAGEKSSAGVMSSQWEMDRYFVPTKVGEGSNIMGPQLMAILTLPKQEKETSDYFGPRSAVVSKVAKDGENLKVTSVHQFVGGTSEVERVLDGKTNKLIKGSCVTKNALGKTVYELKPIK